MNEGYEFVVWADNQSGDAYNIEALSYEGEANSIKSPPISAGDFIIVDDKDQNSSWFGQVIEPQRNLALQGLSRDNPSNIAAMERVLSGSVESSIFLRQVYYYHIRLMGEIDWESKRLRSVIRRPRAGACGRRASEIEVLHYLDLPPLKDFDNPQHSLIGRVYGVNIPIALDDKRLYQHLLVAGATGSGKSNTVANVIKAAQAYGMCVIVFDHKPDYQNVHEPNDEISLFRKYEAFNFNQFGLDNVQYFSLYEKDDDNKFNKNEKQIAVRASDVPSIMLGASMFYRQGEELQREAFGILANEFISGGKRDKWTLDDFLEWYHKQNTQQLSAIFEGTPPMDSVLSAMERRLKARRPTWMDSFGAVEQKRSSTFDNKKTEKSDYFVPASYLQKGKVLVIRVNTNGAEYGLFLSYMLREVYNLRRNKNISFPILNIIDEAQDIFQAEKEVRNTATHAINEILRKGRSKQVGFVFAVQSATQLPNDILNNLNSRIIHRQNTREELQNAIPGASRELLNSALSFGAGEALVSILGARGIIHGEMAPSPFMLTKDMPMSLGTLADQYKDK